MSMLLELANIKVVVLKVLMNQVMETGLNLFKSLTLYNFKETMLFSVTNYTSNFREDNCSLDTLDIII